MRRLRYVSAIFMLLAMVSHTLSCKLLYQLLVFVEFFQIVGRHGIYALVL